MAQKSQKAALQKAPAKPPVEIDEVDVPQAKVVEREQKDPSIRRAKIGGFVLFVLVGWTFILGSNKFHVTAPVVIVCLSYLAVLFTVVNLWRTGATAAGPSSDDEGWGRPIGARGELEKEKRTLLKGIKEAEFDAAMGKLSKADADSLIRDYRRRAIEVIKELDGLSAGAALSTKEQIAQEVRARIALDSQAKAVRVAVGAKSKGEIAIDADADAAREAAEGELVAAKTKAEQAAAKKLGKKQVEVPVEVVAKPASDEAPGFTTPAMSEAEKAKASAEADAIAAKVQQAAAAQLAVAEAKAAAAHAAAEAAEAKAAAAHAAAEAAEAKAAVSEAADDKGERA